LGWQDGNFFESSIASAKFIQIFNMHMLLNQIIKELCVKSATIYAARIAASMCVNGKIYG